MSAQIIVNDSYMKENLYTKVLFFFNFVSVINQYARRRKFDTYDVLLHMSNGISHILATYNNPTLYRKQDW